MIGGSSLTTRVSRQGDISVIGLQGYLAATGGEVLEKAFGEVADSEKILLVFGGDDFINSAGLAVLFDLILPAKEKGVQFRIVHPAQHFRKVFEIIGLSKDVGVFLEEREVLADW